MIREYPSYPILAVSAIIFNLNHELLLIQRSQPPAKKQWALPGGAVQLGETPEYAVIREVQEECAIHVLPKVLNRISSHVFRDSKGKIQYHYVVINYICRLMKGEVQAGSDALDYQWVLPSAIHKLNLADGVYETVQEGLKNGGKFK